MLALPMFTIIKRFGELRRIKKMSRAELDALKLEKFRKLVRHAKINSPYYAEIIAERNINIDTCTPSNFPVLTKSILMANFDRIVTDKSITKEKVDEFLTCSVDPNEFLFDKYRVIHTSGSSGEMGYFVYSPKEWIHGMMPGLNDEKPNGGPRRRRFGRLQMAYYAAVGGHFAGVSMMSTMNHGIARLFSKINLFEINSPLPEVIERLNKLQPDFITGYTTGLKILAEKQNEGVLKISPMGVGTGGEAMTQTDKAMIESAFNCEASNGYGSTEHLMMGAASRDGETMTLFDSDLTYELFDDHCLITNLFNYTQPLIRYQMSDVLRPIEQTNPAAPYLVVNSLVGRTEKIPTFINRDGAEDFIHPISVVELFIAGVTRFQMRLINKTSFRFYVVLDQQLNTAEQERVVEATQQRLREFLNQKLMDNVLFEVVSVTDIPVDQRTGKFKLIVDENS